MMIFDNARKVITVTVPSDLTCIREYGESVGIDMRENTHLRIYEDLELHILPDELYAYLKLVFG
jgi:hypothetical protein